MNIFEKNIRTIADFTAGIFGHGYSDDAETGNAPMWSVIFIAVVGLLALALVVAAACALLAG